MEYVVHGSKIGIFRNPPTLEQFVKINFDPTAMNLVLVSQTMLQSEFLTKSSWLYYFNCLYSSAVRQVY